MSSSATPFDRSNAGRTGRARGTKLELDVARALREEGWVVGSMRHTHGGGDLIASRAVSDLIPATAPTPDEALIRSLAEVRLIECKGTSRPYERFGPTARQNLAMIAKRAGATAWLAWRPKGESLIAWYRQDSWPT